MDLQSQLYELEQYRMNLIKHRDELIAGAEKIIRLANRDFDSTALELGRQINELRERLKVDDPPADKKERTRRTIPLEGLDDEDQAHYQELLTRKKKRS